MAKKNNKEKVVVKGNSTNKYLVTIIIFLVVIIVYFFGKNQGFVLGSKYNQTMPTVDLSTPTPTDSPVPSITTTTHTYYYAPQPTNTPVPTPTKVAVFLDGAMWNCDPTKVDMLKSADSSYSQSNTTYNSCMAQASQKYNTCYSTCLSASNVGGDLGSCTKLCSTEQTNDQSFCSIPLNAAQQSFFNLRNQYCGN